MPPGVAAGRATPPAPAHGTDGRPASFGTTPRGHAFGTRGATPRVAATRGHIAAEPAPRSGAPPKRCWSQSTTGAAM